MHGRDNTQLQPRRSPMIDEINTSTTPRWLRAAAWVAVTCALPLGMVCCSQPDTPVAPDGEATGAPDGEASDAAQASDGDDAPETRGTARINEFRWALQAQGDGDEVAPAVVALATDDTALTITFNELLGTAPSLANGSFAVKKVTSDGTEQAVGVTGSPSVSGRTVTLTMAAALAATDRSFAVSYTRPMSGTGNRIVDAAGNEARDFTYLTRNTADAAACAAPTTSGRRELVRTVLTPADMLHHFTAPGYGYFARTGQGALSTRSFVFGGQTYRIQAVHLFEGFTAEDRWAHGVGEPYLPDDLMVSLDPPLSAAHKAALRLHVCDATFDFDATRAELSYGSDEHDYVWGPSGLDWSSLSARTLAFSRPLNVCDRTPSVRDAIVAAANIACESVTTRHLAAIRTLTIAVGGLMDSGLKDGDFAGLTGLTRLNLEVTGLTALPEGIFDELTALSALFLSRNSLAALPARVFDKLTGLTVLHLQENDLTALPADVFEKLTSLSDLRLEGNTIQPPYGITANAGSDSRVNVGDSVTLEGSTSGPWGDNVATWSWVQVSGANSYTAVTGDAAVTLTDANTATASFTAPALFQQFNDRVLYFRLTVTGRGRPSANANDWIRVTVNRRINPGSPRSGPEARFENVPAEHDGSTPFDVELHFSPPPEGLSYKTVAGGLLNVTGGTVKSAKRKIQGSNGAWLVSIQPTGKDSVFIELPARPCGTANAICVGGKPLAADVTATVPGPPRARFEPSSSGAPAAQDGEDAFTVKFHLRAEPAAGARLPDGARFPFGERHLVLPIANGVPLVTRRLGPSSWSDLDPITMLPAGTITISGHISPFPRNGMNSLTSARIRRCCR